MKQRILHDVESFPDFFCTTIMDFYTQDKTTWEISVRKNELDQIYNFYNNYKDFLISFNGISYDTIMINFICTNYHNWKDEHPLTITGKIKLFSDYVISTDEYNIDKDIRYYHKWIEVDLYRYWSKDLRLTKQVSLKALGIQLGYPVVQELPYPPSEPLGTSDKMDKLITYNRVHDLNILYWLLTKPIYWQGKPTTFLEQIEIRRVLSNRYKINLFTSDAPGIVQKVMRQIYINKTGLDPKKDIIPNPEVSPLQDPEFKLPKFKKLFTDFQNKITDHDIVVIEKNTSIKLSYGRGGIHSVNNNEIYIPKDDEFLVSSDVASLYPNLIINYKLIKQKEILESYIDIKNERMIAKKNKDKGLDASLKLILNSFSGLIDNEYSYLYFPEGALKMRLMGQLILTKLIEEAILAGYKVVSANTDGVELIIPKSQYEHYLKLVAQIEKQFNLEFEHTFYKKIVYSNVNSYIAVGDGFVKTKGEFVTTPDIGNSCNFLVIPKALEQYYVNNIKPSDFIKNHNNIFDFCASFKIAKKFKVFWNDTQVQQLNRFYAGGPLAPFLYRKNEKKKNPKNSKNRLGFDHLFKDSGIYLFNNSDEDEIKEINYNFYLTKILHKIKEIEYNNIPTLF